MSLYLNPFAWGMRRIPIYNPSIKTENLILNLNKKYNLKIEVGEVIDTLWYFRDLKNHKIDTLENFELQLNEEINKPIEVDKLKNYVNEFNSKFEHKKYFDSISVIKEYDSLIFKTKIR